MKTTMKQYNQEDMNKIASVKEEVEPMVRDAADMITPNIEVKEVKPLTHDQLMKALLFIEDILQRALCPFMVLGETAECIMAMDMPILEGNLVHLGILNNHYSISSKSTILSLLKQWQKEFYDDENIISFTYHGVPVQIDIIHKEYPFFKNPDVRFFNLTEFRVPNPFDDYLIWKDQIK